MLIRKVRGQIDAAIELYFHEGDEQAHSLVGSTHILVTDLSKATKFWPTGAGSSKGDPSHGELSSIQRRTRRRP